MATSERTKKLKRRRQRRNKRLKLQHQEAMQAAGKKVVISKPQSVATVENVAMKPKKASAKKVDLTEEMPEKAPAKKTPAKKTAAKKTPVKKTDDV
ncbi:MAG: hypothetical protein IBX47_06390 [Desulfuromonadales bacterium]|nr:hypothetical protein [Desulfuromonadales bacterium]